MKLLSVLTFMLFTFSINAQITSNDLVGEWKMVTKTPIGDKKQNFTIQLKNNQLIGITKNGKVEITLSGNQLSWENSVKTPLGIIDVLAKGALDQKGNIAGYSSPISGKMKNHKLSWIMRKL